MLYGAVVVCVAVIVCMHGVENLRLLPRPTLYSLRWFTHADIANDTMQRMQQSVAYRTVASKTDINVVIMAIKQTNRALQAIARLLDVLVAQNVQTVGGGPTVFI